VCESSPIPQQQPTGSPSQHVSLPTASPQVADWLFNQQTDTVFVSTRYIYRLDINVENNGIPRGPKHRIVIDKQTNNQISKTPPKIKHYTTRKTTFDKTMEETM
jgi:hypothetical protein